MKRKFMCFLSLVVILSLTGCDGDMETIVRKESQETQDNEPVKDTYIAEFYDNFGGMWLQVEGKEFSINPNKVKQYAWNSDGVWTSYYEMSSVMSITIDEFGMESCGSTVIFADSNLEKYDIDLPKEVLTESGASDDVEPLILQPKDLRAEDWLKIQYWWSTKSMNNKISNERIVIIMSQNGNPICMYTGENVTWDIPKNLPKTTSVIIDGKVVYIHRTNFAIIDAGLLNKNTLIKGENEK